MTAFHMKDYAKAVPALTRCLALAKPHESIVRKVYAMLAGSALHQRDYLGARRWVELGLGLFANDPELLFRAGVIYKEVGDLGRAEASYLRLLTEREVGHIDSLDVTMAGNKAHHNLALVYQDMQRWPEAEAHWRTATELAPAFVPSWLGLADLYLRLGNFPAAEGVIAAVRPLDAEAAKQMEGNLQKLKVGGWK
jgi:tetratricopeptide (TPR) repeat protein